MKASELRIGNWVMNSTSVDTTSVMDWQVVSVSKKITVCQRETSIGKEQDVFKLQNIEGIPLTSEWLLKFGFKHDTGERIWIEYDNLFTISYSQYHKGFRVYVNNEYEYGKEFEYVHQLQNWYFLKVGQELTVKE